MPKPLEEIQTDIRSVVYERLKHGGEGYAGDFMRDLGSHLRDRRLRQRIYAVLVEMEREGEVSSRIVTAKEHGEGHYFRRYYRGTWSEIEQA